MAHESSAGLVSVSAGEARPKASFKTKIPRSECVAPLFLLRSSLTPSSCLVWVPGGALPKASLFPELLRLLHSVSGFTISIFLVTLAQNLPFAFLLPLISLILIHGFLSASKATVLRCQRARPLPQT